MRLSLSVCLTEAKLRLTRKQILEEYSNVFTGIGCFIGDPKTEKFGDIRNDSLSRGTH